VSLSAIISAGIALLALVGGAYYWGLFRNKKAEWESEKAAETAKERAEHAEKVAEIFAKPKPANWADTVDRL
jgi:hypothetical protein